MKKGKGEDTYAILPKVNEETKSDKNKIRAMGMKKVPSCHSSLTTHDIPPRKPTSSNPTKSELKRRGAPQQKTWHNQSLFSRWACFPRRVFKNFFVVYVRKKTKKQNTNIFKKK